MPEGTSAAIVAKLENAMKIASTDPEVLKISAKMKFPIYYRTAAETTAEMRAQWIAYSKLTEATGYNKK